MKITTSLVPVIAVAATALFTACRPPAAGYGQSTYAYGQTGPSVRQRAYIQPANVTPASRQIYINGAPLSAHAANVLTRIENARNQTLPNGSYWYDKVSGAAGSWGGPTENFLPAGLELGPPLPKHASAGNTGVIINNREIHRDDYNWLANLLGQRPMRGRYWLDANGNVGIEGGPALGNLVALANQRNKQVGGASGSSWGNYDRGVGSGNSIGVAGDGQTTCVNTAEYTRCY